MNRHVKDWISVYSDGELNADRRKQVEEHLASCAECREELESLRKLSSLLKEAPSPALETPPEVFAARVQRRLPPRSPRHAWQATLRTAWQAAPAALVGGWMTGQVVLALAGVASLAWLGRNYPAIQGAEQSLSGLLRGGAQGLLIGLPLAGLGAWAVLFGALWFGFTFTTGILLWGWLASWWAGKKHEEGDKQWTTSKS